MISIALPIHKMDKAEFFLTRCLDSIFKQSFKDFEVVVTDNSDDDDLKKIATKYGGKVRYFKNPRKGMAQNTNEAMRQSKGELIKILYMDDYFAHRAALKNIYCNFNEGDHWLITSTDNNRNPHYTEDIHTGNNKLGSPSALTILNKDIIFFDEEMTWLLDCDYYKRMYEIYGEPTILLGKVNVIMGTGEHQISHILTQEDKQLEADYMNHKYYNEENQSITANN